MLPMDLRSSSLVASLSWWIAALGVIAAELRLFALIEHGLNPDLVIGLTTAMLIALLFSAGLTRRCVLDPSSRTVERITSLYGCIVNRKSVSVAQAAWVRARITGSYNANVSVEVGTSGYLTTELVSLPNFSGRGVAKAEIICAQVANALEIPNKGFKGLA